MTAERLVAVVFSFFVSGPVVCPGSLMRSLLVGTRVGAWVGVAFWEEYVFDGPPPGIR
jgi:hypothetical protein